MPQSSPSEPPVHPTRPGIGPASASARTVETLSHADIAVHFQPIVRLSTGELFAYEALVRCRLPDLAQPFRLFEEAERVGCCGRIGRMIRDVAFSHVSGTPLFVNVHPSELNGPWLVRPDDPIGFHDADVFLEVTESAAFERPELTVRVLREVCSRVNARLVVDDLGAGHADIFRVLDLEPDVVKLDRALVAGLHEDRTKQKRLDYFVDLCTELGALVVVEGVETEEELRAVRDTGAPYVQGYLLGRPSFPPPPVIFEDHWVNPARTRSRRPPRS